MNVGDRKRVLFVCMHNSARSQIAEALLKDLAGDRFDVMSAGFEPGQLNPLAVEVMKEIGIDISHNQTKSAFDLYNKGELFSYVITVCDAASAEQCPLFSGLKTAQLHWSFEDPSIFTGTYEERLARMRSLRDNIRAKIAKWLREIER